MGVTTGRWAAYGPDEMTAVWTAPAFGCVQWEPRDA
jgi:hypothetical protein